MRSGLGKRVLGSVGLVLGVIGITGIALTAYIRIHEGHGADPGVNGYGQLETWAGYAGRTLGGLLLVAIGFVVAGWQLWRRSRLEGISAKEILKELKRNP